MPERTFATGVVIGKFYPPHHGHTYLIDVARAQVDHLTVIVCDRAGQTIPGHLRAAWLRELHPDVEVMRIDDVYPPDDSRLWAELTIRWLGYAPDAVFTSEDYGDAYAHFMGSVHVLVDGERICSGTDVRADPLACWEYLAPCVRAYFCKRVCVVGAESSGTTTLAAAVAAHYNTLWVPEYGRTYYEAKMRRPDVGAWRSEDMIHR
jgi:NadR type nicotinamide-nucleotide adenylyltransferase